MAYARARSRPASITTKTTRVVQLGSSSAAASHTENPAVVTSSRRVSRSRSSGSGRRSDSAQTAYPTDRAMMTLQMAKVPPGGTISGSLARSAVVKAPPKVETTIELTA